MDTYRLTSSPLIYAPGILAWAINGYKFPRDRANMLNVVRQTWNLSEECAEALLSGNISYRIEDDAVTFQFSGTVVA